MAATIASQTRNVRVAGLSVKVLEGGSGAPLVVVHHDIGNPGWTDFYDKLAQKYRVIVPDLPGYGESERPVYARHPRDLAILMNLFIAQEGLEKPVLVGLGFGGWLAAEMATMAPTSFSRLVLVNPVGIKPPENEGEILDQMMVDLHEFVATCFSTPEAAQAVFPEERVQELHQLWDFAREMTARIAWKPYMFSHQLPHLLGGLNLATLVVMGHQNKVVPIVVGQAFARALPNAKMEVIEDAGHLLDMEKPAELANLIG